MDESGHDHKRMPYEVRGGVAIHAGKLWPMVQQLQQVELASFGIRLHEFRKEIKGSKLLDKDRFKWAAQSEPMEDAVRRKHCRGFLTKGLEKKPPSRDEFTAYGQACLEMARGIFQALRVYEARLFAAVIPASIVKPATFEAEEYLRKDHVFLLERFFYFLEVEKQHGVLVFDQVDKGSDQRFVRRMERYFSRTGTGRYRSAWIVPVPMFVASDMSYAVQAADLCIYSLNWGFRLPALGMNAATRSEIATEFGPWLNQLQYRGQGYREGNVYHSYGIVYVPDPYDGRE
ncbi:hypothetical protein B1B_09961 [mine drainage metagenome]|uniref:DUF3800 domain-containing protein n=1 Tax=mine drainage metagenome TaxID=410659 RepID=T1AAT9_9ZZZZ